MAIIARSLENYQVEITDERHIMIADEPESKGGDDAGPMPYDFLLSALAGCKIITVQMYANRKEWVLGEVKVKLWHEKVLGKDCADCESEGNEKVDIIRSEISFSGDLTKEQIVRLKEISDRCPIHRTLTSETKIYSKLIDEEG